MHDKLLTMRRGAQGLSGSFTRRLVKNKLMAHYGSEKQYAATHEFGSTARNIKARPGVMMTEKFMGPVMEKILVEALKKEGL